MSKSTIAIIVILACIVLGTTYVAFAPDSWKFWRSNTPIVNNTENTTPDPSFPAERITAKHQFTNGTHIVAGEVNLPTPCYILTTDAMIAESYPEQVTLRFVAKTNADTCAQVITTERFKINFTASENASIKATWNGKVIPLNLIPAGVNEDLNDFELFIKG